MTAYKRAPIVDALIQLQFAEPFTDREVERIALKAKYPQREDMVDYNVEIKVAHGSPTPSILAAKKWQRLASADGTEILAVQRERITVTQHAPYAGWSALFERFIKDYEVTKSIVGNRRVSRVGVRYINRLDVPSLKDTVLDVSKYLNMYPRSPILPISEMKSTQSRLEFHDPKTGLITLLNAGSSQPVLLNHDSYMLDIDVIKDRDIPLRQDELLDLLKLMRDWKNKMFEAIITDETRKLIDA